MRESRPLVSLKSPTVLGDGQSSSAGTPVGVFLRLVMDAPPSPRRYLVAGEKKKVDANLATPGSMVESQLASSQAVRGVRE